MTFLKIMSFLENLICYCIVEFGWLGGGGADFKAGGLKRRNSKRLWDGGP